MALALVWKEQGKRSQDALSDLLRDPAFAPRKGRKGIGHSGTLDPFAEGWLLVGVDEGTKLLSAFQGLDKNYEAEILIGATSASLDPDEKMQFSPDSSWMTKFSNLEASEKFLEDFLNSQIGEFQQVPPAFSAIHVGGQLRAYDLARKGQSVELKARPAKILEAQHLGLRWDHNSFEKPVLRWRVSVRVSSGTYIRALARDWCQMLISYEGMLSQLLRSDIGGLGRSLSRKGVHYLSVQDLSPFFDLAPISSDQAEGIRRGGLWKAKPILKSELLVVPESFEVLAFTEAPHGNLGRVFLNDPLSL